MSVDVLNKYYFLLTGDQRSKYMYLPLTVKETVHDVDNPLVSVAVYAMLCVPSPKEDPDGGPLRLQKQKERETERKRGGAENAINFQ